MLFIVYDEVFGDGLGFTYGSKFSNGYGVLFVVYEVRGFGRSFRVHLGFCGFYVEDLCAYLCYCGCSVTVYRLGISCA